MLKRYTPSVCCSFFIPLQTHCVIGTKNTHIVCVCVSGSAVCLCVNKEADMQEKEGKRRRKSDRERETAGCRVTEDVCTYLNRTEIT